MDGVNFTALLSGDAPHNRHSDSSSSDSSLTYISGRRQIHTAAPSHAPSNLRQPPSRGPTHHPEHPSTTTTTTTATSSRPHSKYRNDSDQGKEPAGARHAPFSPASVHHHHEPDREEEYDDEYSSTTEKDHPLLYKKHSTSASLGNPDRTGTQEMDASGTTATTAAAGNGKSPVYMMFRRKPLNPHHDLADESNSIKDAIFSILYPEVYLPVFYSLRMTLLVALPLGILARHPKAMTHFPAHVVIPLWGIVDSRNTVGEQIAFSFASYQCGLWMAVWGELNNIFGLYFHPSAWWCTVLAVAFVVMLFGDYRNKRLLVLQGVLILQMEYLAGGYKQQYALKVGRDMIMATTFALVHAFIPPKSVARQCDRMMAKGWKHIGLVVRSSVHALWSEDPIVCVTELSRLTTEPLQTLFNDLPGQFFFVMYEFWESTLRLELRRERLIVMKDCTPSLHALTDCVRALVMRRIQKMTTIQQAERQKLNYGDGGRKRGGRHHHHHHRGGAGGDGDGDESSSTMERENTSTTTATASNHVPFGHVVPPEQDLEGSGIGGPGGAAGSVKSGKQTGGGADALGYPLPTVAPTKQPTRFQSSTNTPLWSLTRAMLRQPTEEFLEALDAVLAGLGETLNPHDVRATVPFDRLQTSAEELQATLHRVHFETLIRGEQEVNPFFYSNTIFFHLTMLSLAHQLVAYGERMRNFDRRRYKSAWRRIVEFFFLDYWNRFWEDLPNRLFLKTPRDIRIVKDAIKISMAYGVGAMFTNYMDPENSYYFGMAILMGVGLPTAGDTMVASVYRVTGMVIACSIAYVAIWHMPNLTSEIALSCAGVFIAGLFRGVQPYAHTAIYCCMLVFTNLNSAGNKNMLLCRIVSNTFTVMTYYAICVFIFPINVLKVSYSIQFRAVTKVRERFSGLVDMVLQPSLGYSDDDDDDDDDDDHEGEKEEGHVAGDDSKQPIGQGNTNNHHNNNTDEVARAAAAAAAQERRRREKKREAKENAALAQQFIKEQLAILAKSRQPMWDLVTQVGMWVPKAAAEPTLHGLPYPTTEMKSVYSSLKRLASATDVLWQGIDVMYRTHHQNTSGKAGSNSTGDSSKVKTTTNHNKDNNNNNNEDEEEKKEEKEREAIVDSKREAVLHIIHGIAPVLVQIDHHVGIVMQDFIDAQATPLTWTSELATEHFSDFLALRYDIHVAFDRAHHWYVRALRRNFRERVRARALRAAVLANKSFQIDPASGSPSFAFNNLTLNPGRGASLALESVSNSSMANLVKQQKKEKKRLAKRKNRDKDAATTTTDASTSEDDQDQHSEDAEDAPYTTSGMAKDLAATLVGPSRELKCDPLTDQTPSPHHENNNNNNNQNGSENSFRPSPVERTTTNGSHSGGGGGGALKEETTTTTLSRSPVAEALLPLAQQAEEEVYRRMTARRDLLNNKKIPSSSSFAAPPPPAATAVEDEKNLNALPRSGEYSSRDKREADADGEGCDGADRGREAVQQTEEERQHHQNEKKAKQQPSLELEDSGKNLSGNYSNTFQFASPDEDDDEYELNNDVNMIISLLVAIDMFFGEAERLLKSMYFINQYERSRRAPPTYDEYAGFL